MFRSSNFDKNLENATSHLRLEPDWPSILLICDSIRQNDVSVKHAFQAIKKKMMSPNPHSAYYALLVLESVVKNCGTPMHEEIATKENCEMFNNFIGQTPHDNVRQKMLELIQTWAYAFRSSEKYQAIKDTMTILKAKGYKFPELKEADAMFTADTAPGWVDGKVCHRCRVEFSIMQRRHHCRNCGQIFCGQCSSKQCPLPKFGIEKEVRVCDGCYSQLQKPLGGKSKSTESDLPVEYLNSSLAQQSQTPPKKSEQELKEEEELQLALALSQSEAEQKNKQAANYRFLQTSPTPEVAPATNTNNHVSIDDTPSDPELAKYLNRNYWEQRKVCESPASPSAPSPMPPNNAVITTKATYEDVEIDEFANNMKSQVEIFVNRMKSNSSRGRSISNDSSVQTLFMNLTSLHSGLLSYIKDMDDKRMWYEQLQDKLTQIKDSRAALDVLRQEHIEKLRRIAEEQERQRQLQMAHKLEIMRKKKQEYLQYQRQLALQRIQEQEREMQLRQEQQKAQYRMGQSGFSFIPGQQNSPSHQMTGSFGTYGYNLNTGAIPRYGSQGQAMPQQGQQGMPPVPMPGMYTPGISPIANQPSVIPSGQIRGMTTNQTSSNNISVPSTATQPIQPINIPNLVVNQSLQMDQKNPNVTIPQQGVIGPQSIHPGILQGQAYVQSQTQTSMPLPSVPNVSRAITSVAQNMNVIASNNPPLVVSNAPPPTPNQQMQSVGQIQTSNPTQGQVMQPSSSSESNAPQTSQEITGPKQQSTDEENNEVTTAELISFD